MTKAEIRHLYNRAGFGITPDQLQLRQNWSRKKLVDELFKKSSKKTPLTQDLSEFDGVEPGIFKQNPSEARKFINRNIQINRNFNIKWIERMVSTEAVLRERMVLFWANHFVCRDSRALFMQQYNNVLREHALGDFRAFTKAVSKAAAMLKYLNNKQNVKKSPNENFARELMELFTLGPGPYTERDVKESARAFTGYFHDFNGEFKLRFYQHDTGMKRFLGKRGQFNGDDIIDIILEQRQCARFICEKIYAYFVSETLRPDHIDQMVAKFYPKYNIGALMRFVFNADWFYAEKNRGTKIKSPIDFIVGIQRTVPVKFNQQNQLMYLQKTLGQQLMDPPNVAGWKGGRTWINSNTMLLRLKLASILLNDGYISTKRKGDFNDPLSDMIRNKLKGKNPFNVETNWDAFDDRFKKVAIEDMPTYLLSTPIESGTARYLNKLGKSTKREYCIQLMSLPEYQMC